MRDFIDKPPHLRPETHNTASLRRPMLHALVFGGIALALLLADTRGMLASLRGTLEQIAAPTTIQLTAMQDRLRDTWRGVFAWQTVQQENAALRQQISQLQAELVAREQAMVENARLRQQLAIEEQRPWDLLGAEVTIRIPDSARRVITIARGAYDGITPGMAVVGQTGTGPVALVGIVETVSQRTATVLLTTDFANRLSVRVVYQGDTTLALMQGQWQSGSRLRIEQAEQERLLQPDAIVTSAGLTGKLTFDLPLASIPEGIPVGVIETATSEGNDRFANVRPYADPDQVRYVWVIRNTDE